MKIRMVSALAYDENITVIDAVLEEGDVIRQGDLVEIPLIDGTTVTKKIEGLGYPNYGDDAISVPGEYSYDSHTYCNFYIYGVAANLIKTPEKPEGIAKWKFLTDCSIRKLPKSELRARCSDEPIPEKDRILAYLKSFEPSAFTSAPAYDLFTGEKVWDADNGFTDGIYHWYVGEIYHFEKYNLKLNEDFIRYVLEKQISDK